MFGFSDPVNGESDSFAAVRIVSINGIGTLTMNGLPVAEDTVVNVADIPLLQFDPGVDSAGTAIASVGFQVIDDGGTGVGEVNEDLTTRMITFDVANLNDAPTGNSTTISVLEDETVSFTADSFVFSDPNDVNQDSFAGVRIVDFNGSGTLTLDGNAVAPNTVITAADLPRLQFTPGAND
jgi:cold shock CspA family protein